MDNEIIGNWFKGLVFQINNECLGEPATIREVMDALEIGQIEVSSLVVRLRRHKAFLEKLNRLGGKNGHERV
jgi:hypothetical protein